MEREDVINMINYFVKSNKLVLNDDAKKLRNYMATELIKAHKKIEDIKNISANTDPTVDNLRNIFGMK